MLIKAAIGFGLGSLTAVIVNNIDVQPIMYSIVGVLAMATLWLSCVIVDLIDEHGLISKEDLEEYKRLVKEEQEQK